MDHPQSYVQKANRGSILVFVGKNSSQQLIIKVARHNRSTLFIRQNYS
jgi:hypothetical protein